MPFRMTDELVEVWCDWAEIDRKSTRLNSSHLGISYAVFCLKKKKIAHEDRVLGICEHVLRYYDKVVENVDVVEAGSPQGWIRKVGQCGHHGTLADQRRVDVL